MALINVATREIHCKVVYYGPGMGGKTSNLQYIHTQVPKEAKGDLLSIAAGDPNDPVRRSGKVVDHFGAITTGAVGLVIDASGMLSLALDRRSAAEELGIAAGDMVVLSPLTDGPPGVTTPVTLRH